MSDVHDQKDASIPLLTDTLVSGNALLARGDAVGSGSDAASGGPSGAASGAAMSEGLLASDIDALAERLQGRCLNWLTGDGRRVIEARCNTALLEHAHWVVGQVSREIGLALETELKSWVTAAVRDELAARAAHGSSAREV